MTNAFFKTDAINPVKVLTQWVEAAEEFLSARSMLRGCGFTRDFVTFADITGSAQDALAPGCSPLSIIVGSVKDKVAMENRNRFTPDFDTIADDLLCRSGWNMVELMNDACVRIADETITHGIPTRLGLALTLRNTVAHYQDWRSALPQTLVMD